MHTREASLALSLHAPNQELRTRIVPTAKRYPLEEIIDALDNHTLACLRQKMPLQQNKNSNNENSSSSSLKQIAKRRAMIEYVMLVSRCFLKAYRFSDC